MTVVDYFADTVRRYADRPALAFEPAPRGVGKRSSSTQREQSTRGVGSREESSSSTNGNGPLPASCFLTRRPPRSSAASPGPPSYVVGPLPGWCMYTWQSYWSDVCMCAKALLSVGATRRSRIAVMGLNSPGWAISFFASIFIDGVAVGVYATNTVDATHHVVSHARCRVAFVDTLKNAEKMLAVRRMQQQTLEKQAVLQQQQQAARQRPPGAARRKRSSAAAGAESACGVAGSSSSSRGRGRFNGDASSGRRTRLQQGSAEEYGVGGDSSSCSSREAAAEAAGQLVEEAGLDTAAEDDEQQSSRRTAAAAAQKSMPFAAATFPSFQGLRSTPEGGFYDSAAPAAAGRDGAATAADPEDEGACQVLQLIVVYAEEVPEEMREEGVMNFDDFLLLGEQVEDVLLTERMETQRAGQCCSIVYTSGTTGFPKGVMLSHDNLTWTAVCSTQMMKIDSYHCLVSFLPLSHVAAQLVDLLMPVHMGCCVFFARPDALQGSLLQTLQAVRPTWFLGVPRVWEKIEQRLKAMAQARLARIRGQAVSPSDAAAVARSRAAAPPPPLRRGVDAAAAAATGKETAAAVATDVTANGDARSSHSVVIPKGERQGRSSKSSPGIRRRQSRRSVSSRESSAASGGDEAPAAHSGFSSAAAAAVCGPTTRTSTFSALDSPGGESGAAATAAGAAAPGATQLKRSRSRSYYLPRLSFSLTMTSLKHSLVEWAKDIGYRGSTAMLEGRTSDIPTAFPVVMRLLLQPIRRALGLDRCFGLGSCAAPLAESTQQYFLSLGMPINSVYGLSETTGPQTFLLPAPGWFKVGSIGHAMPSTDVLVASEDSSGQGELCFRGRNVFMGYYKDAKATEEVLDRHAFLHTGDLGTVDEEGFLFITGRIKELIITAGGENVAPLLLESHLIQELPNLLSNCMVVGDRRRFLAVLVCLHTARGVGAPPSASSSETDLSPEVLRVIQPLGSHSKTLQDAQEDPIINALVKAAIERANGKTISRAQTIQGWRVLPSEFSVETGELTATMKLRRKVVEKKFAELIDEMYEDPVPRCLLPPAATHQELDAASCAVTVESPPHIQSKL